MSVNKYKPHLLVLPEDDANRQIAVGFQLGVKNSRSMQVLSVAKGWEKARDTAKTEYFPYLEKYPDAHMVLLIDFDSDLTRSQTLLEEVPEELRGRFFVVGTLTIPEKIKAGSLEDVGKALIDACAADECPGSIWDHELLKHNVTEGARAKEAMGEWLL